MLCCARETLDIAGMPIRRRAAVVGIIASANRDPSQFADPDTLDIAREPNRHMAFGQGGHDCVGAPLARLEGGSRSTRFCNVFRRCASPSRPIACAGGGGWCCVA